MGSELYIILGRYNWHVCSYLWHKHKLFILSRLSDYMACKERFNIQSEGSISQLWNTVGR